MRSSENHPSHKAASVLIVGGGPTGLVLGLTLLRNGVSVRIIEKQTTTRIGQRGAGIMPRSLELFNLLGILPEIEKTAHLSPPCCIYDDSGSVEPIHTFELSPYIRPTPSTPHPNILLLGQDNLEKVLRDAIARYGVEIEYGLELITFEQHEHAVTAHIRRVGSTDRVERCHFQWLLGADGARGVTRKLLGCTFLGTSRNLENLIVGDIIVDNLDRRYWHMWGDASTTLISLRPTEHKDRNLYNLLMVGKNVDMSLLSRSYEDLVRTFKETTNRYDLQFGELVWCSNYRPNIRMVDKFGDRRVIIAGDAAHVHSPTGGQGMNTGIQDSFNLAWKLALVHKGLAPMSLLESYDEERLPVIAEMLNQTTILLERSFQGKGTLEEGQSAWHRGDNLHQLSVNYRWSSILVDETMTPDVNDLIDSYGAAPDGLLHAGDRAPDSTELRILSAAPEFRNKYTRVFKVISCARHTALVFSDKQEQYAPVVEYLASYRNDIVVSVVILPEDSETALQLGFDGLHFEDESDDDATIEGGKTERTKRKMAMNTLVLEDTESYAYDTYGVKAGQLRIVIIRPDGVIGGIVHSTEGLEKYFAGLFGLEMVQSV